MINLEKKQEKALKSFVQDCCTRFEKNFVLDEKLSNISLSFVSLMVLEDKETSCKYFSILRFRPEIQLFSNLIPLPTEFLNISFDRKVQIAFVSLPGKYLLLDIHGNIVHKTVNLDAKDTKEYLAFSEEVAILPGRLWM